MAFSLASAVYLPAGHGRFSIHRFDADLAGVMARIEVVRANLTFLFALANELGRIARVRAFCTGLVGGL